MHAKNVCASDHTNILCLVSRHRCVLQKLSLVCAMYDEVDVTLMYVVDQQCISYAEKISQE